MDQKEAAHYEPPFLVLFCLKSQLFFRILCAFGTYLFFSTDNANRYGSF